MSKAKSDNKDQALFDAGVKKYSTPGRFYYDIGYKPSECACRVPYHAAGGCLI